MDRKSFFEKAFTLAIGKGLSLVANDTVVEKLESAGTPPPRRQRPPGAAPEESFPQLCTGCDACMIACPVDAIMIDDWTRRLPLIYPDEDPCVHCDGYPCIQACATGALDLSYSLMLRDIV